MSTYFKVLVADSDGVVLSTVGVGIANLTDDDDFEATEGALFDQGCAETVMLDENEITINRFKHLAQCEIGQEVMGIIENRLAEKRREMEDAIAKHTNEPPIDEVQMCCGVPIRNGRCTVCSERFDDEED